MKRVVKRYGWCVYALLFLCSTAIIPEGFVAETLVHIPNGYACIEDLNTGDEVFAHKLLTQKNNCGHVTSASIAAIGCHEVDTIIQLTIDDEIIELAEDQLLFVPLQRQWLPASQIREGMYLLGVPLHALRVKSVTRIEQRTYTHALSLQKYHTYAVGHQGIVVHNFGELVGIAIGTTEGLTFLQEKKGLV